MNAVMAAVQQAPADATRHDTPPLRVGTRGSPLALIQTRDFIRRIADAFPMLQFQENVITTTGDAVQDRLLADIGGKGLFAKEIHEALMDRRIDFAVHSLKDLETELPRGITLGCTLPREDPRDMLILNERHQAAENPLDALPPGAVVGTSSIRRQAQLLHARPDLKIVMLRGNVQTRLAKLRDGVCDATILAIAGLHRLGMDLPNAAALPPGTMVPSSCQGIVGITIRACDEHLKQMLTKIEDQSARIAAMAERSLLAELDGSCHAPIGAYAKLLPEGRLRLTGMVARGDGTFLLTRDLVGRQADAERLGQTLGTSLYADSPADIFG